MPELKFSLFVKLINLYGKKHQIQKVIEECAELIVAVHNHRDGKATASEELDELVDVSIMIDRMRHLHGHKVFDEAKKFKIEELKGLVSLEEKKRNAQGY